MPSNFRTYEAQSRLLAAVLASSPNLKLNFKAIAQHYGSDTTPSSIEHRFRPIKKQAAAVRQAVSDGKDAKDMTAIFHLSDKEIAKFYGESTPQGIEFQFRAIRQNAKAVRDAVANGQSPLTVRKNLSAAGSGPGRKRKAQPAASAAATGDGSSVAVGAGAGACAGAGAGADVQISTGGIRKTPPAKRARAAVLAAAFSNEDDSLASDVDYEQLDLTPASTPHLHTASPAVMTPAVPFTPLASAGMSAGMSFATDATPALTVGGTPPDNSSPITVDSAPLAAQQQPQSLPKRQPTSFHSGRVVEIFDVDDDDNDDATIAADTPSKPPKIEIPSAPLSSLATLSAGGNWDDAADTHLGSDPLQSFSFASSNSWPSVPTTDFFPSADPLSSFSTSVSQSFYDEGSI